MQSNDTLQRTLLQCTVYTLLTFSIYATADVDEVDAVAAVVNDGVVTISQIEARYHSFLLQVARSNSNQIPPKSAVVSQILERLILESIQFQEAGLRGIVVNEEEITAAVRLYAQQNNMELEAFREMIESQGITYAEFREDVHRQLLLERVQQAVINRRIFISEQDIKELRENPWFQELLEDRYRVGHILIDEQSIPSDNRVTDPEVFAADLVNQLTEGADFATMAVNYSSATTALDGGDLGWRSAGELPSLFIEVVLAMEEGEVAEPIRNARGIHIIKLIEKQGTGRKAQETLVRHILIQSNAIKSEAEAMKELQDIRQRIEDGEDFEELASEFSDDPGTARNGGDLGWTDGANLDPLFLEIMNASEIGELSEVFASAFGWHILEVINRREADLTEDDLNNRALQILYQRQFEEVRQDWLKEIRDDAYVKIVRHTLDS